MTPPSASATATRPATHEHDIGSAASVFDQALAAGKTAASRVTNLSGQYASPRVTNHLSAFLDQMSDTRLI